MRACAWRWQAGGQSAWLGWPTSAPQARGARRPPTDVADGAAIRDLVGGPVAWGRLDVLVNNAGVGVLAPVEQTTPAEFERLMRVNPRRRPRRAGRSPHMAGAGAHRQRGWCRQARQSFRAAYVASKFALVGFSETLRMELRGRDPRDVRLPGRHRHGIPRDRAEPSRRLRAGQPIRSADHVARAIVRAIRRPRAEVHPFLPARLLFLANAVAPSLVDRVMMRFSPRARAR
jgi:short-subunit dehydrogenase